MTASPPEPSEPAPRSAGPAALLLTAGGLTAAFGAAACCALPLILTGAGIGTTWLGGVGLIAAPHRSLLLAAGAALLLAGAWVLWRQQRAVASCPTDGVCARPAYRLGTVVGLLIGAALLGAAYVYG